MRSEDKLDFEEMTEESFEESVQQAETRAIHLLSRREHSRLELEQKLLLRKFNPSVIQVVLDKLAAKDWQSDLRFTESFVRSRISQSKGPNRIIAELAQKGIGQEAAHQAMEKEAVDWVAQAVALCLRKYKGPCQADRAEYQKRQRFLAQRGYSLNQINKALGQLEDQEFDGWEAIF